MSDGGNPYRIEGPALISFSGGRTSAYMLRKILDAYDGQLPPDVHVCFANTGKEREETLRFVHECGTRWGVDINWLEFVTDRKRVPVAERFEVVGYNSASRNGEPLSRLIKLKRALFSTVSGRWCTEHCKIEPMHNFMEAKGLPRGSYTEVIGFRADEGDRAYELPRKPRNRERRLAFPLAAAGVRKPDVFEFWKLQPFDLQLARGTGNCDHCPFLNLKARIARMRLNPEGAEWWEQHEAERGFTFGYESFAEIKREVAKSPLLTVIDEIEADAADSECAGWCGSESA